MTIESNGIGKARNGNVEIAYETFGPADGRPLLLISGMGVQMLLWDNRFCAALVENGFAVARFDNRDVGLSTHLPARTTYRLSELVDDAFAVLDALGWPAAHVVGVSLGGMIAQAMAIRESPRVLSLTCISSTPASRVGARPVMLLKILFAILTSGRGREGAARGMVNLFKVVGSPGYPHDEDWLREVGRLSYDRARDGSAGRRHSAAIGRSTDHRADLARLRVPTLVIHGEADRMITIDGGRAIAAAVPNARLVTYPGMGHDLPRQLWPSIIDEITAIAT